MTFILLLFLQFSASAQKDSTKSKNTPIYSLTDTKTKGTATIRLRPTRFLFYQSIASSSNAKTLQEFSDATSRSRDQITQSNVIPIGILNADVEISADGKEKKKDFILMASPIQKDIFQANVQFQLSPKLLQTNLDNQIESIEISFDNGDNWKSYKYEEQLISYQFSRIGEQDIGFRINSKKGTFVTFATVDVKQLTRPSFVETKRVSAPAVKGGRIAGNVNGAEYRIHMGCDGIFDKPIIIAEGFDAGQNVNLDDLTARYFGPLELYRNNGYDLVLVNYDNGRTWIQDNAQVLKAVINQVNTTKVGNNKLVVIGESMSGLIARYALKQMENAGQNHNVSHFVAFDTPMKGANVPTGLIALRRWAPYSIFPISNLASFLNDVFDAFPAVHAIDEPAAKQMLLTQQGSTPAPEFFQFQTEINNLGYPSQNGIKNIALINGALDGAPQRRYLAQYNAAGTQYTEIDQGQLNQGDRILDYSIWSIFDVVAWTHRTNVQGSYVAFGNSPIAIWVPAARFYLTSPINYDIHPGGRITSTTGSVYTSFGFVPTFSSIDYRGSLSNDNDFYLNIRNFINGTNQVTNSALTPFAAIYGNDENNDHAKPRFERNAIDNFGITELGMVSNGGCIGCTAGSGGLQGTYFDNINLTTNGNTRTSPNEVNFSSDERRYTPFWGSGEVPPYGIFNTTNILARWEGSFEAPLTATYNFNIRTDDGVRLWFDGIQKVDDWGNYPPKDHPFQVALNAGERKNVRIEWFQGGGGYEAKFMWSFNGVQSIVPACRLFATVAPVVDCNFAVTATSNPATTTCGGTSSLSAGCTGTGCTGVTYAWSGNGGTYNGTPVTVTLPNLNGAVGYTLTGSKVGCANKTDVTTVTVGGCNNGGGGTTTCIINKVRLIYRGGELNNNCCFDRLVGSKIQGSNDNSTWTDLYTFSSNGNGLWQDFTFSNSTSYSYVRFVAGPNSYGELTEIEFYNGTTKLSGTAFGTASTAAAQDGNITTSWHAWPTPGSGNYVGLQLSGCAGGSTGQTTCSGGNFMGNVDVMNCNQIAGWCFENGNLSRTVKVDIFSDGQYVTSVDANQNRPDLGAAFNNNAAIPHGFSYSIPNSECWKNGANHVITVKPCGGSANITSGSANLSCSGTGSGTCGGTTGGGDTGGGTTGTDCPTPTAGNPVVFHWDNASQSVWFAHLGPTGQRYASFGQNPGSPALTHTQLANSGVPSTKIPCFLNGVKQSRVANSVDDNSDVEVYPNPTNGKIKVGFTLQQDENVWLNLYDSQGRNLQLKDFEGKSGRNLVELDLQDYPSGAYFINFQYAQKREVIKVMKVN
jgi:hypothetical protein